MIRVVWTSKTSPTAADLHTKLLVRTARVYEALQWLCHNNEDYRDVTIDYGQLVCWPTVYVLPHLLDCMGHISSNVMEEMDRSGPATNDLNPSLASEDGEFITSSAILDADDVSRPVNALTLRCLVVLVAHD